MLCGVTMIDWLIKLLVDLIWVVGMDGPGICGFFQKCAVKDCVEWGGGDPKTRKRRNKQVVSRVHDSNRSMPGERDLGLSDAVILVGASIVESNPLLLLKSYQSNLGVSGAEIESRPNRTEPDPTNQPGMTYVESRLDRPQRSGKSRKAVDPTCMCAHVHSIRTPRRSVLGEAAEEAVVFVGPSCRWKTPSGSRTNPGGQ